MGLELSGYNVTGAFETSKMRQMEKNAKNMLSHVSETEADTPIRVHIHPLYKSLQARSEIDVIKGYKIKEFDNVLSPISLKEFYSKYVSHSYPVIIRKECLNWPFKEKLDSAGSFEAQQNILNDDFENTIWPDRRKHATLVNYSILKKQNRKDAFKQS